MKNILTILLLSFPFLAKAESFSYNQLILVSQGADNFSVDKDQAIRKLGTIDFDGTSISIDSDKYALKPMKKANFYKSKKGIFQMVYVGERLAYVQHYRYGKIYNYRIQNNAAIARGRNSN